MGSLWSTPENEEERVEDYPRQNMDSHQHSLQPKKLRNAQVTILKEILRKKVMLNDQLVAENNAILKEFLNSFIPEMKKHDQIFELLYQKIYYTGSFFSDLRISKPDEFDLNLVLKMPKSSTVTYHPQVPSYMKMKITDENHSRDLTKLCENGYLILEKVRVWMQSVVDKALKSYKLPNGIAKIHCSASGPARTLKLRKYNNDIIDIDFVPAFECLLAVKPPGIHGQVYARVENNLQCFLVPKPYQTTKQAPVNDAERRLLWRAHYPVAEKIIIHDLGCVKPIIKLLKLLRDKENWKSLASYYLKTVIMWMIMDNPSKEYWKEDKMGERFLDALRTLGSCVKAKQIRYFFSSRYNLLDKLSDLESFNIHNRICAIIKDIEKDDQKLWSIFACQPTFTI